MATHLRNIFSFCASFANLEGKKLAKSRFKKWKFLLNFVPVAVAASTFASVKYVDKTRNAFLEEGPLVVRTTFKSVLLKADQFYRANEHENLISLLLEYENSENAEVYWRLARALCVKAKIVKNQHLKHIIILKAFEYAEKSLKLDDGNSLCHKWYGITLDFVASFEGTQERISRAYVIRDHLVRAMEINPDDPSIYYWMGKWCFTYADLSWYQRQIANYFYSPPPQTTFHQALEFFQKAEEIQTEFYTLNYLMIGKTYLKLKNFEKAKTYLLKTLNSPVNSKDANKAHKEAVQLIKQNKFDE